MHRVVGFLMLLLAGFGAFLLASMMGAVEASPAGAESAELAGQSMPVIQPAGDSAPFPTCVDFQDLVMPSFMYSETIDSPPAYGRVRLRGPYPGRPGYWMDLDTSCNECGGYTWQAGILRIDLEGENGILLDFHARDYDQNDEDDGVYVSDDDGVTWGKIHGLGGLPAGGDGRQIIIELDVAAAAAGRMYVDGFLIKFQTHSNEPGGFAFGDICVVPRGDPIQLIETIGTTPGICGTSTDLTVATGSEVVFCYRITNTAIVTLTDHMLVDSALGTILDHATFDLPPGATETILHTAVVTRNLNSVAEWTGANLQTGDVVTGTDSVFAGAVESTAFPSCTDFENSLLPDYFYTTTIDAPPAGGRVLVTDRFPAPAGGSYGLDMDTNCNLCGGYTWQLATLVTDLAGQEKVWLDFRSLSHNDDSGNLNAVYLSDDGGVTWKLAEKLPVKPFYEHGVIDLIEVADDQNLDLVDGFQIRFQTFNRRQIPQEGFSLDDICLTPERVSIAVTTTVGLDPALCANKSDIYIPEFPAEATYCYQVENTGEFTFTNHTVTDDQLGTLWDDVYLPLGPGELVWFTQTVTLDGPVTSMISWEVSDNNGEYTTYRYTQAKTRNWPTDVSVQAVTGYTRGLVFRWWQPAGALLLLGGGWWLLGKRRKQLGSWD